MSPDVSSSHPPGPGSPEPISPQEVGLPPAVDLPEAHERPVKTQLADNFAFFLSAVLSPYIVIPVGTLGIVYARAASDKFLLWAGVSLLFSVGFPVLYILWAMKQGTITDVHVMEREQRSGPFLVAIIGSVIGAFILIYLKAPTSVWGLNLILAGNGILIGIITRYTKISVHVCVLTATVLGASILHTGMSPFAVIWLIPLLMWARIRRKRHTLLQCLGGFGVAVFTTVLIMIPLGLKDRLFQFLEHFMI